MPLEYELEAWKERAYRAEAQLEQYALTAAGASAGENRILAQLLEERGLADPLEEQP